MNLSEMIEKRKRSSMLYWWPKLGGLGLPMPETVCYEITERDGWYAVVDGEPTPSQDADALIACGADIGYPLFLRTDHVSGKHNFAHTCFVLDPEDLLDHCRNLVGETLMHDLDLHAFFLREFIEPSADDFIFEPFNDLPIRRERRYFIRDGRVVCKHPYWPEDALDQPLHVGLTTEVTDWREQLEALNDMSTDGPVLDGWVKRVADNFEGYWSVDFMYSDRRDGMWHLIDMADGDLSWHPPCEHNLAVAGKE
jgi:hypothetical protein